MKILLPTIIHTGTTLCDRYIFRDFENHKRHVTSGNIELIFKDLATYDFDAIVVPLRHPTKVLRSYKAKGFPTLEMFHEQWNNMINIISTLDPFYLHIDCEERDLELQAISDCLNVDLPNEWPVLNATAIPYELPITGIPEEFVEFYNSTRLA